MESKKVLSWLNSNISNREVQYNGASMIFQGDLALLAIPPQTIQGKHRLWSHFTWKVCWLSTSHASCHHDMMSPCRDVSTCVWGVSTYYQISAVFWDPLLKESFTWNISIGRISSHRLAGHLSMGTMTIHLDGLKPKMRLEIWHTWIVGCL